MSTMTSQGVKCGNHRQPTYHADANTVRECFRNSGKGSQRVESLDEKLDQAFGEPTITQLDTWREREFDQAIQERERAEDERVAREKLDRDAAVIGSPVTEDGMYRNPVTGQIFKVYHTVHGRNVQVAKELVVLDGQEQYQKIVRGKEVTIKAHFIYRGIAPLRTLTASMQMTLAEAQEYGALYGVCIRCATTLTKEVSIERAMGDVCAGKANWA